MRKEVKTVECERCKMFRTSYSEKCGAKVVAVRALKLGKTTFLPLSVAKGWHRHFFDSPLGAIQYEIKRSIKNEEYCEDDALRGVEERAALDKLLEEVSGQKQEE